jgi:tRNA pseudouridine38-40 synthase
MRRAAELLVGTQDYASFRTSGSSAKTSVRTVYEFDIEESKAHDGIIKFRVRADGFLYNMMRNMVGTLLEVGLGKLSVADVAAVLKARDRRLAGPTAPACGLYLVEVEYPSFVSSSGS